NLYFMDNTNKPGRSSRRQFFQTTGLAAMMVSNPAASRETHAANSVAAPSRKPLKGPIRLGIVGGHFGAQLYWHEHPQCEVVAVSDLITERRDYMKEVYHCGTAYDSLEAMLTDENLKLDAIALFTDATRLAGHCIKCLEKGWHVVAASPAAMNLDEARALRDAVNR